MVDILERENENLKGKEDEAICLSNWTKLSSGYKSKHA